MKLYCSWTFLIAQLVKNLPAMQELDFLISLKGIPGKNTGVGCYFLL